MSDTINNSEPDDDQNEPESEFGELEQDVLALLKQNQKIAAVKLVREKLNCGLKEAKDAVETVARKHDLPDGTIKAGCSGMILLAGLIPTVLAGMAWCCYCAT